MSPAGDPPRQAPAVGLGLQGDLAPGEYAELARIAESAGLVAVSVYADALYQPPLPALLEVASATTSVRLGPACWNPFTTHPLELAGQVAALDQASEGRAWLGLTAGAWLDELGVDHAHPVDAVADAAAIVAALLRGDGAGHRGRRFSLPPGAVLRYPVRRDRVPLLIGAWRPRMAALAGAIADEVKVGGSANADMVAVMRERLAVGASGTGRDVAEVGIVLGAVSVVDDDGDAARAAARSRVAMYLDVVAGLDPTVQLPRGLLDELRRELRSGRPDAAGRAVPDAVLDRFAFAGTPEHVAGQVATILRAGAARVDLGAPHGLTPLRGVELIGRHVLPAVAGALTGRG